jgi:hypothetical protein
MWWFFTWTIVILLEEFSRFFSFFIYSSTFLDAHLISFLCCDCSVSDRSAIVDQYEMTKKLRIIINYSNFFEKLAELGTLCKESHWEKGWNCLFRMYLVRLILPGANVQFVHIFFRKFIYQAAAFAWIFFLLLKNIILSKNTLKKCKGFAKYAAPGGNTLYVVLCIVY